MHASQAIVKPGGTGTPRFVISARFAPLPPRIARMSRVPSAPSSPKKYTDFMAPSDAVALESRIESVRVEEAMSSVSGERHGPQQSLAGAAEPQLVGIRRWRRGIVAREACVAKAVRSPRHRGEHPIQ